MATNEELAFGPWRYEAPDEHPAQVALDWAGVTTVIMSRVGDDWVVERAEPKKTDVHGVITDLVAAILSIWKAQVGDGGGLAEELKILESRMEELRNDKQRVSNEFQHLDQIVNQTMEGIARVLRALGQMQAGTGMAKPGM